MQKMNFCGNGDCSYSGCSFCILQRHNIRPQYENKKKVAVYSGCQRMSERDAENDKDSLEDAIFKTDRPEDKESV